MLKTEYEPVMTSSWWTLLSSVACCWCDTLNSNVGSYISKKSALVRVYITQTFEYTSAITGHNLFYMWKKKTYNHFPRWPLINIYVYISVKCMIYHFLHRTLHKGKNTNCFSLCNKAWISWSRKRSLKQQLIQPINGVVSSIMIWLYIYGQENIKVNIWKSLKLPWRLR